MIVFLELNFLSHYLLLEAHPAAGSPGLGFKRWHHKLSPLAVQEDLLSSHWDLSREPELLTATHWQHSDPRGNQGTFFFFENWKWEKAKWHLLGIVVLVRGEETDLTRCKWENNRFHWVSEALNGFRSACSWLPCIETTVSNDGMCFQKKWVAFSSKGHSTFCHSPNSLF